MALIDAVAVRAAAHAAASRPAPAQHLLPLPGGTWSAWRQVCLRGAGLPAAHVLRLAAPSSAALADRLIAAEARGEPEAEGLRHELRACFEAETLGASRSLRELARDPLLREAVAWQNAHALRTGIDALARKPAGGGDRKVREKERLLAGYLQRYCVKNDSIGFFGPVGWGSLVEHGPDVHLEPGPQLLARREVYFEGWCIDELARALEPGLRAWLCPRLAAYARLEGRRLYVSARAPVELSAGDARVLAACDGETPAHAVAALAAADPETGLDEAQALEVLERLRRRGLVVWTLEGPLELHPERRLRRTLAGVGDADARAAALAALDRLEAGRASVAAAAGHADRLGQALEALAADFTRLTGAPATRSEGLAYAGRTLVYEDARRDVHLELGPGFLERLGPPLSLVAHSARWCSWQYARRERQRLERAYDELAARAGGPVVELSAYLPLALQSDTACAPFDEVLHEAQARWQRLLGLPSDARRVTLGVDELRAGVAAAFDAPGPGWSWARYVSPDVLIAADDAQALRRGDYLVVLGEIHLAHTHLLSALAAQNPRLDQAVRALEADHPAPRLLPEVGKAYCQRLNLGVVSPRDYRYEYACAPSAPAERRLRRADMVLERRAGRLEVRTRDARVRFEALEFLGYTLMWSAVNRFGLLPRTAHTPRVTLDGVVIQRERWQFAPQELAFARLADPLERFLGARRFAQRHGLPRFAFFKAPHEPKPCYLDFASPIYVDVLAKQTRAAPPQAALVVTEMLPRADQAWLVDAQGRRYTSELRIVALDAAGPAA